MERGLTMNFEVRIEKLRKCMSEEGEDLFLVTDRTNGRYLTGFTGSSGWALVSPQSCYFMTDGRYWDQLRSESPHVELVQFIPDDHVDLAGALKALLLSISQQREKLPVLGLELDGLGISVHRQLVSVADSLGLRVRESSGRVKAQRVIKEEPEIAALTEAAAIADRSLSAALKNFSTGNTELDLKAEIEYQILKSGGEGTSFSTIVASGVNGSRPHAGASRKTVEPSELITVDFGALYNGYCSDMTRTIWYGALPEQERTILSQVRQAQQEALNAVRAGIAAGELDRIARSKLAEANLDQYFIHSLGHSLGLEVHESPGLRKGRTDLLEPGTVVTIEPGVYIPQVTGCRVEDTVVVRAEGCTVLTNFPKQQLDETAPPTFSA